MLRLLILLLRLSFLIQLTTAFHIDPSDFFTGSKPTPRLEIEHPENGEVLDDSALEIRLSVKGYDFPSSFHDSNVCLGLQTGEQFFEECFEQTESFSYHVNGLIVGAQYSLRVVLIERDKAIAVSVRNFKVGGIFLPGVESNAVTVKSALQVAMQHHTEGDHTHAEKIYRQVLGEHPSHPDALHLMGLIFYQRGDPSSAIPYIERALSTNKTFEGFHNSLGECFRVMGRMDEAKSQFELALALNPKYSSAAYNLGLTYQGTKQWDKAIQQYKKISHWADIKSVNKRVLVDSKIRECDLQQALGRSKDAFLCWREGTEKYSDVDVFYNELGNFYGQFGKHRRALELYQKASLLGSFISEVNSAHMSELLGRAKESRSTFSIAISRAEMQGLPSFHLKIRRATVLPRVIPLEIELKAIRKEFEKELETLLVTDVRGGVDNTPPLYFGFSLGHLLTFHGENNREIREKLYRVYLRYCPALSQGFFIDMDKIPSVRAVATSNIQGIPLRVTGPEDSYYFESNKPNQENIQKRVGFFSRFFHSHHQVGHLTMGLVPILVKAGFHVTVFAVDDTRYFDDVFSVQSMNVFHQSDIDFERDGGLIDSIVFDADSHEGKVNNYPALRNDHARHRVKTSASEFVLLPADINDCADLVRNAKLDLLVYPELGADALTYFLAYARLAPVQALWLGDGDTTGIETMDYIITSSVDTTPWKYTEKVFKMSGLGTSFIDDYFELADGLRIAPRSALLERAKFAESLGLPRAAHLYIIACPLTYLHPKFDAAVSKILSQDKLGYAVVIDSSNRTVLQRLYVQRLVDGWGRSETMPATESSEKDEEFNIRKRVVFFASLDVAKNLLALASAHVVLDPFPASRLLSSFQAIAMGIPVITLKEPTARMSGRFTQALYSVMNYTQLVAPSVSEYTLLALSIAHNLKTRAEYVEGILKQRHLLFETETQTMRDWTRFVNHVAPVHKE